MGSVVGRLFQWALKKSNVPNIWEDFSDLSNAWESSQCNDWDVFAGDSHAEASGEAKRLAKKDPAAGFQALLHLANRGSVWSMLGVGYAYHVGLGVEVDAVKSEDWYRKAFEGGAQRAQLYYGVLLILRGDWLGAEQVFRVGVVDDWAPAMHWFSYARLRQSDTRKTFAEVMPLLERGSAKGSLACEIILARRLRNGVGGWRRILEGCRRHMAVGAIMTRHTLAKAEQGGPADPKTDVYATPTIH